MRRSVSVWVWIATTAVCVPESRAAYDFTVIASSEPEPFSGLGNVAPSLDAEGRVAFLASAPELAQPSIFVGSALGHELVDYVQISGAAGQPTLSSIQIGSIVAGAVGFMASGSGGTAVYYGAGGSLTPLFGPVQSSFAGPAVNFFGDVVLVDGGKLVLGNALGSSILLQKNDDIAGGTIFDIFNSATSPDINDAGETAFWADIDFPSGPCDEAIMKRDSGGGGTLIALGANDQCDWVSSGSAPIALSESGHVAFDASIPGPTSDVNAAFVDQTEVWDETDPGFGASPHLEAIAVNDAGTPALLVQSASGTGVYTGSDPVADKVLATGDSLCGSAVTEIVFHRFGLNDDGQLALLVSLADARRLVVRAERRNGLPGGTCVVPEPSDGATSEVALLVLAAVTRRRARRQRESLSAVSALRAGGEAIA
jgi:hypothetical protein